MNKFWQWLKQYDNKMYEFFTYIKRPKQMYIGFMIEYLFEKRIGGIELYSSWNINEIYEYLKNEIKELNQ